MITNINIHHVENLIWACCTVSWLVIESILLKSKLELFLILPLTALCISQLFVAMLDTPQSANMSFIFQITFGVWLSFVYCIVEIFTNTSFFEYTLKQNLLSVVLLSVTFAFCTVQALLSGTLVKEHAWKHHLWITVVLIEVNTIFVGKVYDTQSYIPLLVILIHLLIMCSCLLICMTSSYTKNIFFKHINFIVRCCKSCLIFASLILTDFSTFTNPQGYILLYVLQSVFYIADTYCTLSGLENSIGHDEQDYTPSAPSLSEIRESNYAPSAPSLSEIQETNKQSIPSSESTQTLTHSKQTSENSEPQRRFSFYHAPVPNHILSQVDILKPVRMQKQQQDALLFSKTIFPRNKYMKEH